MNKYKFKPKTKVIKKKKKGLVRYIYTLLNDDNDQNNLEMKYFLITNQKILI